MSKKEADKFIDDYTRELIELGHWPCKYCSNENWTLLHRPKDLNCTKTDKPREDAEIKDGYKG